MPDAQLNALPALTGAGTAANDNYLIEDVSTTTSKRQVVSEAAIALAANLAAGSVANTALVTNPLARANHTGTQLMATISDAGALATKSAVASADITDGTIVDLDINAAAAISADKTADGTTNKAFLATERTKLAGVATAATANSSDATLEARANHTGTQLASTISNFDTQVATTAVLKSTATTKGDLWVASASATPVRVGVGADTFVLTADAAQTAGVKWAAAAGGGGASSAITVKSASEYVVPDYQPPPDTGSSADDQQMTYYWPIYIARTATLDALACHVVTAQAGAKARLGVYNVDANLAPTTLLVDYGAVDASSTGLKEMTGSTSLAVGWYALAGNISAHGTVRFYKFNRSLAWHPLGVGGFTTGFSLTCYRNTGLNDRSAGLPSTPDANTAQTPPNTSNIAVIARFS